MPGILGLPGSREWRLAIRRDAKVIAALVDLARQERIDLTIVGPEVPLSLGVGRSIYSRRTTDRWPDRGGRAHSSRAKRSPNPSCRDTECPAHASTICESAEEGLAEIRSGAFGLPVVIKADGLAAGKGVVIATSREEAEAAVLAGDARAALRRCRCAARD